MLVEVVMAAMDSQSPELMSRLRASMEQAILGDVDGFFDALTGTPLEERRSLIEINRRRAFHEVARLRALSRL